jgi:hypothetical protein
MWFETDSTVIQLIRICILVLLDNAQLIFFIILYKYAVQWIYWQDVECNYVWPDTNMWFKTDTRVIQSFEIE